MNRDVVLLLIGAMLHFLPAPATAQDPGAFIEEVTNRTRALQKGKADFQGQYPSVRQKMAPLLDDWQRGFDPAVINPALAAAKSRLANLRSKTAAVRGAHPRPEALKEQARQKKVWDKPGVQPAHQQYEKEYQAVREIEDLEIQTGSVNFYDHAGPWKILTQRLLDAGKGGDGVKGSPTLVIVGKSGLEACRVYGGKATPWGSWWFEAASPPPAIVARPRWALPPSNHCEKYRTIRFREGAHVERSANADLFGFKASGTQLRFCWEWHQASMAPAPWHPSGKLKSGKLEDWCDLTKQEGSVPNK